ncbi:cobalamin biosynthesis protein CobG [Streptomyces bugieae]|uniref:Cobalamin biosynthesis protein CobG n=1 Tax=Streptomyces bugieae TaxID=3098223 RepID=A0ABU7NXY8_9ACTN|nr:cobalamin biosynthesis protein CobG [Streptomyces sp. DSM 41528]
MPPSPSPRPRRAEPPVRARGDACPGALRLHPAADGHLARVRIPAGDLTVHQARALADAADLLGDGRLSLTSRGNVELRGLPDGCGGRLAGLLHDAGLLPSERHERIRNILASPLAGLDRNTPADVRRWARRLDALLCASDSATALSGRFLFVLDDGRGDVAALGGDVTLIAESGITGATGSGGGALLRVGDDPAALRIAGPDAPRAALAAAETFLAAAAAGGTGAWRVRELPDGHRLSARDLAEALRAAGIEATYVADGAGASYVTEGAGASYVAEGAGVRAATPGGPVTGYADSSAPGIVEGRDGRRALSVLAPLGRLSVAQWRLLASVAADDGSGELRLTPWRGIVVPGLPAAAAAPRLRELAAAGLVTDPSSPWHRIGACTGRPGCAKSRTDVRADVTAAVEAGEAGTPLPRGVPLPAGAAPLPADAASLPVDAAPLPVHWSGCERRCGHPHGSWIDVLATEAGYRVAVVGPEATPATPTTPKTTPTAPPATPGTPETRPE